MKTCHTCQQIYPEDMEFCPRDGARLVVAVRESEAQLAAGLSRRFHIIRRLGSGGMGTVYLAEQIGVGNRPVALKVLNRTLMDDPQFLLRFQNEAGSTGRIRHANVVTIYESAQADDGTLYIAMEFLEGETLRDTLKRRGALPLPEVVEILQQAARGLNAAHKLGIIHRDLKPDNIFMTRGEEDELVVKVVDFGIAKLRESALHTTTNVVLGTPAYMSCEQASGMRSDELDARSDVYSLGIVVYEMLTGRVPFHSDTPLGFLRKHMLEAPPPFPSTAAGMDWHPEIELAVMKALRKERGERHATTLDFARALASAGEPTLKMTASAPLPVTRTAPPAAPQLSPKAAPERIVAPPAILEPAVREPVGSAPLSAAGQANAAIAAPLPTADREGENGQSTAAPAYEPAPLQIPKTSGTTHRSRWGNWVARAVQAMLRSLQPRFSLLTGGILVFLTLYLPVAYQSCDPPRTGLDLLSGKRGSLLIGDLGGGWVDRWFYVLTLLLAAMAIILVLSSLVRPGVLRGQRLIRGLFGAAGTASLILLSGTMITAVLVGAIFLHPPDATDTVKFGEGVISGSGILILGLALRNRAVRRSKVVLLLIAAGCLDCLVLLTNLLIARSWADGYFPSWFIQVLERFLPFLYWFLPAYLWFRYKLWGNAGEQAQWPDIRGGIVQSYLPCVVGLPFILFLAAKSIWGLIPYTAGNHLMSIGYLQLVKRTEEPERKAGAAAG